jgi:predicted nucleic acid-binding protein
MTGMRFVDTNVLIYAASPSAEDADKRRRAQELLREGGLAVSVQVLQEFYSQVTRANRVDPLSPSQALRFIESLREFPVQDITLAVFRAGVALSQRFRLSYWDGAILAAAHACGCEAVYTEDLSDGQDYEGLRVINPFRERGRQR